MRLLFLGALKKVVGGKWDTKEVCYHGGLPRALPYSCKLSQCVCALVNWSL